MKLKKNQYYCLTESAEWIIKINKEDDKEVFFAPALPLEEVFDPTGAGDTFAGGFAGFIAQSENVSFGNLKNAVIFGSNMASFCVEKFGTQRMQELTKEEVNSRLQQFRALTQFDIALQQ